MNKDEPSNKNLINNNKQNSLDNPIKFQSNISMTQSQSIENYQYKLQHDDLNNSFYNINMEKSMPNYPNLLDLRLKQKQNDENESQISFSKLKLESQSEPHSHCDLGDVKMANSQIIQLPETGQHENQQEIQSNINSNQNSYNKLQKSVYSHKLFLLGNFDFVPFYPSTNSHKSYNGLHIDQSDKNFEEKKLTSHHNNKSVSNYNQSDHPMFISEFNAYNLQIDISNSQSSIFKKTKYDFINNYNNFSSQVQSEPHNFAIEIEPEQNINRLPNLFPIDEQNENEQIQNNKIVIQNIKNHEIDEENNDNSSSSAHPQTTFYTQKMEIKQRMKNPQVKYRQSKHKNVFKNFGTALLRFINYNSQFKAQVAKNFSEDKTQIKNFYSWIKTNMKFEKKQDFITAWTWYETDSEQVKNNKDFLRQLSLLFFQDHAIIYLMNTKKLTDIDIHFQSIYTFIQGINNPSTLEKFKPL